jgi:lysozyme
MKVSKEGLKLLKHHEGFRKKPYLCAAKIWTIGYGHAMYPEQMKIPSTPEGMAKRKAFPLRYEDNRVWSVEEIDELLVKDVVRFERAVLRYISVPLKQHEFDALISAVYNLGAGWLQRSQVRQKINRGDKNGAMENLLKFNKGGGKVLRGLDNRRKDEVALFLNNAH